MFACESSFVFDSTWSLVDVVRLLLDHGADPNRVNGDGKTALSLSILQYRHEVVAVLLDHGAIVTAAAIAAFATTAVTMSNWETTLRNEGASVDDLAKLRRTETRWSNISWQLSLRIREDDPLYPEFNRILSDRMEHKQRVEAGGLRVVEDRDGDVEGLQARVGVGGGSKETAATGSGIDRSSGAARSRIPIANTFKSGSTRATHHGYSGAFSGGCGSLLELGCCISM